MEFLEKKQVVKSGIYFSLIHDTDLGVIEEQPPLLLLIQCEVGIVTLIHIAHVINNPHQLVIPLLNSNLCPEFHEAVILEILHTSVFELDDESFQHNDEILGRVLHSSQVLGLSVLALVAFVFDLFWLEMVGYALFQAELFREVVVILQSVKIEALFISHFNLQLAFLFVNELDMDHCFLLKIE